jgi:hypothetical protein
MKRSKWETVGQVCIDTAAILLCDPCHVDDIDIVETEKNFVESDDVSIQIADRCEPVAHNLAVMMQTGIGDGYYNVDVKKDEDGMIYEMRIKFRPQ